MQKNPPFTTMATNNSSSSSSLSSPRDSARVKSTFQLRLLFNSFSDHVNEGRWTKAKELLGNRGVRQIEWLEILFVSSYGLCLSFLFCATILYQSLQSSPILLSSIIYFSLIITFSFSFTLLLTPLLLSIGGSSSVRLVGRVENFRRLRSHQSSTQRREEELGRLLGFRIFRFGFRERRRRRRWRDTFPVDAGQWPPRRR